VGGGWCRTLIAGGARGLTQAQAGVVLGIKQPHVSAPMRTLTGNFSVGRLMEFLNRLGQDVKIAGTSRRARSRGRWKWWWGEIYAMVLT